MKNIYIFLYLFIFSISAFAQENKNIVDCLILEDENSIICKYTHQRIDKDHSIMFQWIDPNGNISRTREMTIPAMHGSIYDYRYIKGREKGNWTFKVIDDSKEFTTTFTLE